MKKVICLLLTLAVIMLMSMVAFAADSSPTFNSMTEYLTWEFLGTMAGAVAATTLITQFLKMPIDKVWKVPTRFVVYIIAVLILFAVELFTGHITLDKAVLIILNAVIVTVAAMGTYDATWKKIETKLSTG